MRQISQICDAPSARPLFAYIGSKRAIAGEIEAVIAEIPHKTYIEPFFGGGGMFLGRRTRALLEVINDKDAELMNLYRQARRHPEYLCAEIAQMPYGRDEFYFLKAAPPGALTEIERAARTLYLQNNCFGGKSAVMNFAQQTPGRGTRWNVEKLKEKMAAVQRRLKDTVIENQDWQPLCRHYDSRDSLFYLDPPYFGAEKYYRAKFARAEFVKIAEFMASALGACVLSINSCAETQAIFSAFAQRSVKHIYRINDSCNSSAAAETLFLNARAAAAIAAAQNTLFAAAAGESGK